MTLLSLPFGRTRKASPRRSPKAFRPSLHPTLEDLERRTVLSQGAAALVAPAAAVSPITIDALRVTKLAVTGANALTATLTANLTLHTPGGHSSTFTVPNLQVPITLTPAATTAGTPILHLSLQIPDLDLLGLHVRLDNCNGGPVTVDINAIPSSEPGGGLLGDLLSGVSNLLNGSGGLLSLGHQTGAVTGALTRVLNGILTDLVTGSTSGTGGTQGTGTGVTDTIPPGDTELVDLHLGPINADILGLEVQTSQICLNLYADPHGGLLGSLLSSLDNLLNGGGQGNV
jgi:hypothetical protein